MPTAAQATASAARSDESLIRGAITGALASPDPVAACEKYVTENYVTESFGDLDGCEAAVSSGVAAKSVEISEVVIDGANATAVAVPAGGPTTGANINVSLVADGDLWRVDATQAKIPVGP